MKMTINNCIGLILLVLLSLCICTILPAALPEKEKVTGRGWLSDDMLNLFGRSFLTGFTTKAVTTLALNHGPIARIICNSDGAVLMDDPYKHAVKLGCVYAVPRAIDYCFKKDEIKDQNTFLYPYAKKLDTIPGSSFFFSPIFAPLVPGLKEVCLLKSCNTQNATVGLVGSFFGAFTAQSILKEKNRSSSAIGITVNLI